MMWRTLAACSLAAMAWSIPLLSYLSVTPADLPPGVELPPAAANEAVSTTGPTGAPGSDAAAGVATTVVSAPDSAVTTVVSAPEPASTSTGDPAPIAEPNIEDPLAATGGLTTADPEWPNGGADVEVLLADNSAELATAVEPMLVAAPVLSTVSSPPAGAIKLSPNLNVASVVSGAASGATFWFAAGTYTGVSVRPKTGQVFLGASGAVLAGNGKPYAFRSGAANVTIRGLVIKGYRPADREGVIYPEGGAKGWAVIGNEVAHNAEIAIKANSGWRITGNSIHHNGRYGITGSGSGILIQDNEIAYNAIDYGATISSGGTKFVHTTNLVMRGNYAHHNRGNGLWGDINNTNVLIENNRVAANERNGIFLEIGCGGVIRNNRVEGNGTVPKNENWMGGSSGILVSNTPNVQVYGNTLVGNYKGIGALNWDHPNRGNVDGCQPELRNLRVENNSITQNGGAAAGIEAPLQTENVLKSWGNRFASNRYILSGGAQFRLRAKWVSLATWNAAGFH